MRARPGRNAIRLIARIRDARGTALIEFAISLPVMLLLFVGGYQLLDASACKRRVTITTRALADLVSQNDQLTTSDVDTILAASTQIMTPYNANNAQLRVTEVQINASGNAIVQWSRGSNPRVTSSTVANWPSGMVQTNTYYIYSEVTYNYATPFGTGFGTIVYSQSLVMLPRKSVSIALIS